MIRFDAVEMGDPRAVNQIEPVLVHKYPVKSRFFVAGTLLHVIQCEFVNKKGKIDRMTIEDELVESKIDPESALLPPRVFTWDRYSIEVPSDDPRPP